MENSVTLSNTHVEARINLMGAELCRLTHRPTGTEHMWQADPKFWGRHAPILFPFVGETLGRTVHYDGLSAPMQRHGFARVKPFRLESKTPESCTLVLTDDAETRLIYPFAFKLAVTYTLRGAVLKQHFEVTNRGTDNLGFQIGGHPAFAVPFLPNTRFDEYFIELDRSGTLERHVLTPDGVFNGQTRQVVLNGDRIELNHQLFADDALVFKHEGITRAWLKHPGSNRGIKVNFEGHPMLGIWTVPGAPYVCIEPWHGCADSVHSTGRIWDKEGLTVLKPNQSFATSFSIEVTT